MVMQGDKQMANTRQTAKDSRMKKDLELIALRILGVETTETRNSDSLDFSDQAIWSLMAALEAAYKAGQAAR